jgi:hypothetical protein
MPQMNTENITVTFNVEEHDTMRELLCLASDMMAFSECRQNSKCKMIEKLREEFNQLWVNRFTESL